MTIAISLNGAIRRRAAQLTAGLVLLAGAGAAHAYTYSTCSGNALKWGDGRATMYISTTSFPAGSSWDARLQNAMWHWNNVKGSRFNFWVNRDTDGSHSSGNGVNEVYLDNNLSGALAVTTVSYHCYWLFGWHYGIDATDIGFNNNYAWSTGSINYPNLGSPYNFEGVALHELGHALGLDHSDSGMATLNSYYPNSGALGHWKEWDPLPDDRQGARALYPDSTTERDIAGSAFKRIGTGSSGLVSSPAYAARGSTANIEFSFANQGTATESFNIGFYLSGNDYISTGDTLLGTNYGAWGTPGFMGTFSRGVYIPAWITPGTYWIGFFVDNNNALAESVEGNNYMEMPRSIVIY